MSTQLLDGLGPTALLLLQLAARHEVAALQVVLRPPLDEDPGEAAASLESRGLLAEADLPGLYTLTPMGYALREAILARWPAFHAQRRERLHQHLAETFDLEHDHPLLEAWRAIDREHFVAPRAAMLCDLDSPVPTGVGDMTTSAPHAVASILSAVAPVLGDRVLVCGAKGGVTLALSAHMVGPGGAAVALDWDPGTVDHVGRALAHAPELAARCAVHHRPDVTLGLPGEGPWQVVIVNGSVPKIPWPLVDQLDPEGGRLLLFLQEPEADGQSCYVLHRSGDAVRDEALSRFVFTPIYGRYGWDRLSDLARHHGG